MIFAATADEEVGDDYGLSWLCKEHPEAVRAAWCINEGGGDRIEVGGRVLYLCATSEKASSPFRIRVHGKSGHASMPGIGENALVKAAPLLERLAGLAPPLRLLPETGAFLATVLGEALPPGGGAGPAARGVPSGRRDGRADASDDDLAHPDRGVGEAQRDPRPLRDRLRLPHSAR